MRHADTLEKGSGAHRMNGTPTVMNQFFLKFNTLKRNNEQVMQKQGGEYFYDTAAPSPFIDWRIKTSVKGDSAIK